MSPVQTVTYVSGLHPRLRLSGGEEHGEQRQRRCDDSGRARQAGKEGKAGSPRGAAEAEAQAAGPALPRAALGAAHRVSRAGR